MIFGNNKKCESCNSKVSSKHSYCPSCGFPISDKAKDLRDFGMLGKNDSPEFEESPGMGFGITDKLVGSLINSLAKNLEKQFKDIDKNFQKDLNKAEIKSFPNGIRIKINPTPQGNPQVKQKPRKLSQNKSISQEQVKKMSSLPRHTAKSSMKRLGDSIVYELTTPGVDSTEDIFISKTEEGYEIKAIGSKKIYANSLPVNLPLKKLSLLKNKLLVEFKTEE